MNVEHSFGFGQRAYFGRWMAKSFIFIVVENVLTAFRIEKPVRDGRVIERRDLILTRTGSIIATRD